MAGFDPCECINLLSQQGRMQRLISMLRDSQADCTDSECLTDGGSLLRQTAGDGSDGGLNFMTLMFGWILLAIVLYFMRPSTKQSKGFESGHGPSSGPRRDQDPAPVL